MSGGYIKQIDTEKTQYIVNLLKAEHLHLPPTSTVGMNNILVFKSLTTCLFTNEYIDLTIHSL